MQDVLASDRCRTYSLTEQTRNVFEVLGTVNSFRHVGQLVVNSDNDFRVIKLATDRGYAIVEDIISTPIQVEHWSVVKTDGTPPSEYGLAVSDGVTTETLTCTQKAEFDLAAIRDLCKHFHADRIGIICSACRSNGRFRKEHIESYCCECCPFPFRQCMQRKTGLYTEINGGTLLSVSVVWIGVENDHVKIFD